MGNITPNTMSQKRGILVGIPVHSLADCGGAMPVALLSERLSALRWERFSVRGRQGVDVVLTLRPCALVCGIVFL